MSFYFVKKYIKSIMSECGQKMTSERRIADLTAFHFKKYYNNLNIYEFCCYCTNNEQKYIQIEINR